METETQPFNPGDVVRLKSGSPDLSVVSVFLDGAVFCIYFHQLSGEVKVVSAHQRNLVRVET